MNLKRFIDPLKALIPPYWATSGVPCLAIIQYGDYGGYLCCRADSVHMKHHATVQPSCFGDSIKVTWVNGDPGSSYRPNAGHREFWEPPTGSEHRHEVQGGWCDPELGGCGAVYHYPGWSLPKDSINK